MKSISDLSKRWDWSNVTAELVPSIAGKWEGWKKIKTFGYFCDVINPSNSSSRTGHPRLMRALETLGLATNKTQNLVVECQVRFSIFLLYSGLNILQGSSIGIYTTQWFNQFYISASGHASALKAHMDMSEGKRKKLEYPLGVKVVFPTFATVKSTGGYVRILPFSVYSLTPCHRARARCSANGRSGRCKPSRGRRSTTRRAAQERC